MSRPWQCIEAANTWKSLKSLEIFFGKEPTRDPNCSHGFDDRSREEALTRNYRREFSWGHPDSVPGTARRELPRRQAVQLPFGRARGSADSPARRPLVTSGARRARGCTERLLRAGRRWLQVQACESARSGPSRYRSVPCSRAPRGDEKLLGKVQDRIPTSSEGVGTPKYGLCGGFLPRHRLAILWYALTPPSLLAVATLQKKELLVCKS